MKIGILTFPIGKVGGIITNVVNFEKGLVRLGHQVEKYFITTNLRKKPDKNDFGWECLGYENEAWHKEYLEKVNILDLIIWAVCCPHLTKSYIKDTWKKCYNIKPKQMAYIHDNYYEKYYPWFIDIPLKYQVNLICPYQYMYDGIKNLTAMKAIIDNPLELNEVGLYTENKKDTIVDHNNWKSIKHKEIVVKYADKINGRIIMYGDHATREYREAVAMPNFKLIEDKGWATREAIYEDLKRAKIVTDMCKRGNVDSIYDYTITEAIAYGCIPVLQTKICPRHKGLFVVYGEGEKLPSVINNLMKSFNLFDDLRANNLKFLDTIKPEKIAKKILDYSQMIYKIGEVYV